MQTRLMKFMPEARYLRELLFVVFKSFEKNDYAV
jgi:hypothetical protein